MIDLASTRAELLAAIGAGARPAPSPTLHDPFDPRVLASDAHLVLRGTARDDVFAPLEVALSARFSSVPREDLLRDLLMPLRSALGNAWKHGNREDPAKSVAIELIAARAGVVVAASDEGAGFDTVLAVERMRAGERYYSHLGAGLERLQRARSVVTWENGGRTVLLCYRGETIIAPPMEVAGWRLFAVSGESRDGSIDVRCVPRRRDGDGSATTSAIVAGRLHRDAAAAAADRAAADALHHRAELGRVRIPRPLTPLEGEPRLVRFDFHPWQSLREYFTNRPEAAAVERRAARVGRALGALHRTSVELAGLPGAGPHPEHASPRPSLIHGRFGLDCVQLDLANDLYLYKFEACRRGDPGLDLDGFVWDLETWASLHGDPALAAAARDAFLDGYRLRSGVDAPADRPQ